MKTWLRHKDKVVKKHKLTGLIEKQWKGTNLNKVYTVRPMTEDTVTLYDVADVIFNNYGDVIKAPPLHQSTWAECEIVKVSDLDKHD